MTHDEIIDRLWQASRSGDTIREDWLDEFIRHPESKQRLVLHLAEADDPTLSAFAEMFHEYADAARRNASKKRRKTQEDGASWQRELAKYLNGSGPKTRLAKYFDIPQEHETALTLCEGRFEVSRRMGENKIGKVGRLIRCEFDDGKPAEEIAFATFVTYLKKSQSE